MPSSGYGPAFARDVLTQLGVSANLIDRDTGWLNAWNRAETAFSTTDFAYNPWATTRPEPGSRRGNSAGVQVFPSYGAGVRASVDTIKQRQYVDVVAALRDPRATQSTFAQAVGRSPWGTPERLIADAPTSLAPSPGTPHASLGQLAAAGASGSAGSVPEPPTCRYAISLPTSPVTTIDLCLDKLVGGLAMTGGALLLLAGVAIMAQTLVRRSGVGQAVGQVAGAVPVGRAAGTARALSASARRERAETREAATARRRAPIEAQRRRDELHQARLRRAERAAATGAARRPAARRRPDEPGLNAGRSTASIVAANRARNARRDAARGPATITREQAGTAY